MVRSHQCNGSGSGVMMAQLLEHSPFVFGCWMELGVKLAPLMCGCWHWCHVVVLGPALALMPVGGPVIVHAHLDGLVQ